VRWDSFYTFLINILKRTIKKVSRETLYSNCQVILRLHQARQRHQTSRHQDKLHEDYLGETDSEEDSDGQEGSYTLNVNDGLEHYLDEYDYQGKRRRDNTMLQARRSLGITDPRDMIYAHVGFASDGRKFVVDYSKTCAQVFEKFALYIAKNEGLYILMYNIGEGKSPSRPRGLPSWVPDWTEPQLQVFRGWLHIISSGAPDVARIFRQRWQFYQRHLFIRKPSILVIFPFETDTVVSNSSVLSVQDIPLNVREAMSARLTERDRLLYRGVLDGPSEDLKDGNIKLLSNALGIWRSIV